MSLSASSPSIVSDDRALDRDVRVRMLGVGEGEADARIVREVARLHAAERGVEQHVVVAAVRPHDRGMRRPVRIDSREMPEVRRVQQSLDLVGEPGRHLPSFAQRVQFADGVRVDRRARKRPPRRRLPARPRARDRALSLAHAREAAAARGRGRRRQDRGGQGAVAHARRPADSPAVLRGPRRRTRRLRVELLAAAPAHPRGAGGDGLRGGAVRARVPDPAAAARGDREPGAASCC